MNQKNQIIKRVHSNEIKEAIILLQRAAMDSENRNFVLEVAQLSSQFHQFESESARGILTYEQRNTTRARINDTILNITNRLFDNLASKSVKVSNISHNTPPKTSNTNYAYQHTQRTPFIQLSDIELVGLIIIFTVSIVGSTLWFFKIPSSSASLESNNSLTELTVNIHGPKGKKDIILESTGKLIASFGNREKAEEIGEGGLIQFDGIGQEFINRKIKLKLNAEGYEMVNPDTSYIYTGEPIYLAVKQIEKSQIPDTNKGSKDQGTKPVVKDESDSVSSPITPQAQLSKYVAKDLSQINNAVNLAIMVIDSNGSIDKSFGSTLKNHLIKKGISADASVLKNAFVTDGLFSEMRTGDNTKLLKLGFDKHIKNLCLVTKKVKLNPNSEGQITAVLAFSFEFVETKTGRIIDSFTINSRRAGASEDRAYEGAVEWVMNDLDKKNIQL